MWLAVPYNRVRGHRNFPHSTVTVVSVDHHAVTMQQVLHEHSAAGCHDLNEHSVTVTQVLHGHTNMTVWQVLQEHSETLYHVLHEHIIQRASVCV